MDRGSVMKIQSEGIMCWAKRRKRYMPGRLAGRVGFLLYDEARLDVEN